MSSVISLSPLCVIPLCEVMDSIYQTTHGAASAFTRQRLPTEAIGTHALTLTNLISGSAIRIEEADGTLREYRDADATSEAFTLQVYAAGSAKNDLVVKVRKGTAAPKYLPFTTYVTAAVGAQSVYIAQVADTIAA